MKLQKMILLSLMSLFLFDLNAMRRTDRDILMHAISIGDVVKVKQLLDEGFSLDDVPLSPRGETWPYIVFAAARGNSEIVQALLDHGAQVNDTTVRGMTPLMTAAAHRHFDVVKILLFWGADVFAHNENGDTALTFAERGGDPRIINALKVWEYEAKRKIFKEA